MPVASKSFTAVGNGLQVLGDHSWTYEYEVSGTWVGTLVLERSSTGGLTWTPITTVTANVTSPAILIEDNAQQMVAFRFRCQAYTSGTIVTEITTTDTTASVGGGAGNIVSINADTTAAQVIDVDTAGTDVAVATAAGTTTISVPTASATNRGALSSADWSTFNAKQSALTLGNLTGTSPVSVSGGTGAVVGAGAAVSVTDAAADGSTKGIAAFSANDFNATAGVISLDYTNMQKAAADGSTKGIASFAAADFDASSGNISIDYTNGQAASSSNKGFLTSADWTTFNGKIGGSSGGTDNALTRCDGAVTTTIQGSAVTVADTTGLMRFPADGGLEFNSASIFIKNSSAFEAGSILHDTAASNRSHNWKINATTRVQFNNLDLLLLGLNIYPANGTERLGWTASVPAPFLHAYFKDIWVDTGANTTAGTATLVGGTVTVSTTKVLTGDFIHLTRNTPGGTLGNLSAPVASITNATSFVINSDNGADTSTVNWWVIHNF